MEAEPRDGRDLMEPRPWHAHYDRGVPPTLVLEELTLVDGLRRSAQRFPDAPAVHFRNATVSYTRLSEQVDALAAALVSDGLRPGDRVAVHMPNLPQSVLSVHGVLAAGGAVVMSNPLYTDDELLEQWTDAGVSAAIVGGWLWADRHAKLAASLPVKRWLQTSLVDGLPAWLRPFARRKLARAKAELAREAPGVPRLLDAVARGRGLQPPPPPTLRDVALLQYTGGTTGKSKGAQLLHANLSANVQQIRAWMQGLRPGEEVFLAALPYFHVFGLTVAMNLPLWVGASIVIEPDPRENARLVEHIEKRRVTVFPLVPAMAQGVSALPDSDRRRVSSLRLCVCGSAALAPETLQRFEALTGARLFEGYGLTETSPVTHCNPLTGLRKPGTIGVPVPDTDARIVDADDASKLLGLDTVGELAVRGPQVMAGYWHRDQETAQVLRDGWFLTGDLAQQDADGYFRIAGRKKEMISVGGYKVYPDDVDHVLAAHPAVAESATIGVPHPRLGEIVKSFVVLKPGASATPEELEAHCRAHLAAYKVPREVELRASLPRSGVLKVLRRELLREELEKRGARGAGEEPRPASPA